MNDCPRDYECDGCFVKGSKDCVLEEDCSHCPLGYEEGYEYPEFMCMVNEDERWCNKSYDERLKKFKELDLEYQKHMDEEAKCIDEYFGKGKCSQ